MAAVEKTANKIAAALILMRRAESGNMYATRAELRMLLDEPLCAFSFSEAQTIRHAARLANAIAK